MVYEWNETVDQYLNLIFKRIIYKLYRRRPTHILNPIEIQ